MPQTHLQAHRTHAPRFEQAARPAAPNNSLERSVAARAATPAIYNPLPTMLQRRVHGLKRSRNVLKGARVVLNGAVALRSVCLQSVKRGTRPSIPRSKHV